MRGTGTNVARYSTSCERVPHREREIRHPMASSRDGRRSIPGRAAGEGPVDRRRFNGAAAITIAGARLGMVGSARAQFTNNPSPDRSMTVGGGTNTSFATLKQIHAGVLNVGYAKAGPAVGRAAIPAPRLALRHPQLRRRRAAAGQGRVHADRPVPERVWHAQEDRAVRGPCGRRGRCRGGDRRRRCPRPRSESTWISSRRAARSPSTSCW